MLPSNDGFKFGEHLSCNGLTNEITRKSYRQLELLIYSITFDNKINDPSFGANLPELDPSFGDNLPKLDPSFGDNLPELDPTSKILHDESLVSTSESALNALETLIPSAVADVEKVEKKRATRKRTNLKVIK